MGNCCTIPVGSGGGGKVKQKAKKEDVNIRPEELMVRLNVLRPETGGLGLQSQHTVHCRGHTRLSGCWAEAWQETLGC